VTDPPLLIFHHLPKTGGTSLRACVLANHRPGQVAEVYEGDIGGRAWYRTWWQSLEEERKRELRCVASHTANHLMPVLDRPFRAMCMLRDPVARVSSLYHFSRWLAGQRDRHGAGRAGREIESRGWTLADVYRELGGGAPHMSTLHVLFRDYFNGQARFIGEAWRPDPLGFPAGTPGYAGPVRDEVLQILGRHYTVGVQERFAQSLERFADVFHWRDTRVPYLNRSPRSPPVDAATRALILAHNEVDAEIHAHYLAAVERTKPRRPRHPPARRAPADVVCVLGAPRSGTAMIARVLNVLGVYLGAGDPTTGSLEHAGIAELNEVLLASWPGSPTLPSGWERDPRVAAHRRTARRLLRESFAGRPVWGWKDPRTCLTLPFWQRLLPGLRHVICVRDPRDVAASLQARDDIPPEDGVRLWTASMRAAVHATEGRPRLFVSYEAWFASRKAQTERVAGFLGVPRVDRRAEATIAQSIDEGRRHQRGDEAIALPAETASLYETLVAAAQR
jgi:hypothetical protein